VNGHTTMGLSLWLPPPPEVAKVLQEVIDKTATKYGGPTFAPHVTLLTKIPDGMTVHEVLVRVRSVVPPEEPLRVTLSRVESGATFFQSVLAAVKQTEYLMALNADVRSALTPAADVTFYPHLSLFYGDPPREKKDAIVQDLYVEGVCEQKLDGVEVNGVESFEVTEIWVVDTSGKIGEWHVVGRESLIS